MNYGIKNWFVEIVKLCLTWFLPTTTFMQRLRYGNGWINHDIANIYQLFPPLKKSPVDPAWKQQQASLTAHSHFVWRVWTHCTLCRPQHFSSLQLFMYEHKHVTAARTRLAASATTPLCKHFSCVWVPCSVALHSTATASTLRFTMTSSNACVLCCDTMMSVEEVAPAQLGLGRCECSGMTSFIRTEMKCSPKASKSF